MKRRIQSVWTNADRAGYLPDAIKLGPAYRRIAVRRRPEALIRRVLVVVVDDHALDCCGVGRLCPEKTENTDT